MLLTSKSMVLSRSIFSLQCITLIKATPTHPSLSQASLEPSLAFHRLGLPWVNVDTDKATRSRIGYPTGFLLRDILQYSQTKEDAIERAFSVRRTNAIFLGVGDKSSMAFEEWKYTHNELIIYNDKNFTSYDTHQPWTEFFLRRKAFSLKTRLALQGKSRSTTER